MKTLSSYYIYQFLSNLFFERSIYMLYLLSKGLSIGQVALFQAVTNLSMFAFEVVTGVIADRIGKKYALIIASVLMMLHHALMLFATEFSTFLFASALFGIAYTFSSGTNQAFLYDLLPENETQNVKHLGRFSALSTSAIGIAGYVGGFLQGNGWFWVFGGSLIAQGLSLIALLPLPNIVHPNVKKEKSLVGALFALGKQLPSIRSLLLLLALHTGIVSAVYLMAQEILTQGGLTISGVSTFYAVDIVLSTFLFANIERVISKKNPTISIGIALALITLCFIFLPFHFIWLPIVIIGISLLQNYASTVLENFLLLQLPDHIRATGQSVSNAISSIVMVVLFMSVSLWQAQYIWLFALVGIASSCWLLGLIYKHRNDLTM